MNNNYARVPSSLLLTLLSIAFCAWTPVALGAGEGSSSRFKGAIPEKNTQYPKVSQDLLQLQQDYSTYQQQAQTAARKDPFTPQAKTSSRRGR